VPQKPQRPFVPHRTPTHGRPAITASEFRLYTPFVPGAVRETGEVTAPVGSTTETEAQSDATVLRPIEDFLDTLPVPPPAYQRGAEDLPDVGDLEEEPYELPPVEHFMDSLPDVDQFASDAESASVGVQTPDAAESGWLETDWQHYDWRAAAALGETANDEATNAWATTDWDGVVSRAREGRQTAAHAIAKALNEIAERIKAGELAVPGSGATPDPTTIASTLAALLGVKR
jgi:hypothetical protein